MSCTKDRTARWNRYWDKKSRSYDREMGSLTGTYLATPGTGRVDKPPARCWKSPSGRASTRGLPGWHHADRHRLGGEHFLRRPLNQVRAAGLDIEQVQRFKLGLVERLVARKPDTV
jgi:hypothetical protein